MCSCCCRWAGGTLDHSGTAANALVAAGVVVVAAAGNSPDMGVFGVATAADAESVIGVASFDSTHVVAR
jgi:minor extracellular serine protease Vpr